MIKDSGDRTEFETVQSVTCTQGRDGWTFCLGMASWKSASTAKRAH